MKRDFQWLDSSLSMEAIAKPRRVGALGCNEAENALETRARVNCAAAIAIAKPACHRGGLRRHLAMELAMARCELDILA